MYWVIRAKPRRYFPSVPASPSCPAEVFTDQNVGPVLQNGEITTASVVMASYLLVTKETTRKP